MSGNKLLTDRHVLLCAGADAAERVKEQVAFLRTNFCGKVVEINNDKIISEVFADASAPTIFFCGDVAALTSPAGERPSEPIRVIKELSYNFEGEIDDNWMVLVSAGQIPINIHGVGVFFKELFPADRDIFSRLTEAHRFQFLTESNKVTHSFRKGIYLSNVKEGPSPGETEFNLLRCSTNLDGPTDNFRDIDHEIVGTVNEAAKRYFTDAAELNHVLAQVYENAPASSHQDDTFEKTTLATKEKKARIKSHSDKTKDMPANGLIAFCTFYSPDIKQKINKTAADGEYMYKKGSVLTKLRFRLKNCVAENGNKENLEPQFDVVLYPGSLFLIPLSTNRLYTHEIVPSVLPVERLPTRLGYVIRCSNTKAVHAADGKTYIVSNNDGQRVQLVKPTVDDIQQLRAQYLAENLTDAVVEYGDIFFSMNEGDYGRPIM